MYTRFNKAVVAAVMGVVSFIEVMWHPLGLSEGTVATFISLVITPALVYLVPNVVPKDS